MQKEILEKNPEADLHVYAVWFNMVSADDRDRWPNGLLTDSRVSHYWDASRIIGSWYADNVTDHAGGRVEWDAYFLYDGEAEWSEEGAPDAVSWGRTIVTTRKDLARDLMSLLDS